MYVAKKASTLLQKWNWCTKNPIPSSERPKITGGASDCRRLLDNWYPLLVEYQEPFKILLLDRANHVLGIYEVSTGDIAGTVMAPRLVFTAPLKMNAVGLLRYHNNPSGNLQPSLADERINRKLAKAGKFLGVQIIDHRITTSDGYFSFIDEGLM